MDSQLSFAQKIYVKIFKTHRENFLNNFWVFMQKKTKSGNNRSHLLTEHSFTDRSALYRIPLELVKNRKLHNEKVFF